VLTLQTPGPITISNKGRKTFLRRFKSFLSRLFRTGKYKKPKLRQISVRKPVIYVFSPTDIDVSVAVTLDEDKQFTAVYPVVPIRRLHPSGEKIQWDVHTKSDGTLVERKTGLELSSLFWEANFDLRNTVLSSQKGQSSTASETWDLSDSNSVVLPIEHTTAYLEKALLALGLHTEARTSFITFWLPAFLTHQYIALRFIPQAEYSKLAPLDITPQPDVVTRVFMVFKGVRDLQDWPSSRKRALEDVSFWADAVGVDTTAVFNKDLSRVLEWGAMELPY